MEDIKIEKIEKDESSVFLVEGTINTDTSPRFQEVLMNEFESARSVTVRFADMPYLGIWHAPKTDAPYVCIEPWQSLPAYDGKVDDLDTKRDMIKLQPKATYKNGFTIEIV
jgi:galactose mutarotase-like enzyme